MPQSSPVLIEKEKDRAVVILNRPDVLNALNEELLKRLLEALGELKEDKSIRVILITGAGDKAFSAGADIEFLHKATPFQIRELSRLTLAVTSRIENMGKIVIAAINGYALGGGLELAEACMLRVASTKAKLGHPEVRIGAISGWGGMARLPRLIGKGRAAELLLTGRMISAEEALEIGLVNRVAAPEAVMQVAEELAEEILENAPLSVWMTWEAMHRGLNMSLEEATQLGTDYFGLIATTEDFREGTKAFLQRRTPQFKGQ